MPLRGICCTHDIALGSHLCLFYRSPKEFIRVTASFLKAGLAEQEFGVGGSATSDHSISPHRILASRHRWPFAASLAAVADHLRAGLVFRWPFQGGGVFGSVSGLTRLARQRGYASVRAVGGLGPFLSEPHRQAFMRYERHATPLIAELSFIGLCCYASADCVRTDMFDIMNAHPRALLRTHEGWTSI